MAQVGRPRWDLSGRFGEKFSLITQPVGCESNQASLLGSGRTGKAPTLSKIPTTSLMAQPFRAW
jgi:hypothetical protein